VGGERLLGLDLGGGGARCLLVDATGAAGGEGVAAHRPWRARPVPGAPTGSDLDAEGALAALGQCVREALARAGARPGEIAGLAVTSMRHGSALLDRGGRELLVTPNRDARGIAEAAELAERFGRELARDTGHWPAAVLPVARLLWLRRRDPERLARAAHHLSLSDWLAFRLCGEIATEPSQAGGSGLLSLASGEWTGDWLERLDLPRGLFPPLRAAGEPLGRLSAEGAGILGLRAGTPVALGGADSMAALLGAGVVEAGGASVVAGTTAPVLRVLDRPPPGTQGRLWAGHHVVPGLWVLESNAGGSGLALAWMAGALHPEAPDPLRALLAEAAASRPGAAGVLSTLGSERMDARRMALPLGHLTFSPLSAADAPERRRHLSRAVLEGLACGIRANLEQLDAAVDAPRGFLRAAGGMTRGALFTRILAEVLDEPVEVGPAEASALGACICAGVGAGLFADLREGARALSRVLRTDAPDPAAVAVHAALRPHRERAAAARAEVDAASTAAVLSQLQPPRAEPDPVAVGGFRPHILVTADLEASGLAALRELGEVTFASYREAMRLLSGADLARALAGVHVLVTEIDVVDAEALLGARDLRAVAVCRGDAVNVDLDAATALGIPVVNTPGRNADAVADLTLAFLLMLARKLPAAAEFLREPGGKAGDMGRMGRAFGRLRGRELWRKTVGLVGFGAVGRGVAMRLRPFGARVLAFDPYRDPDAIHRAGACPAELHALLAESDFVSLHAPVTEATRGLLDRDALARAKPGACLVNTARAALVDEEALVEALASGHLAGAALDVFGVEPPASDHPLLAMENVIATPHVGGNTEDVAAHQGAIVAEELSRLARGERPRHALNPEVLATFRWDAPRPDPDPALRERLGGGPGPAVTDLQKGRPAPRSAEPARERPARPAPEAAPPSETETPVDALDRMQAILREFTERARGDEALAAAAAGRDATLHFALPDLDLEFHLGLRDGAVTGGLGAPEGAAEVQLSMPARILDGMFTGRVNAMQAAMDGEMSFSGDTAKAMTLQHLQRDLSRLYRAAREAVGDPGDLSRVPGGERPGAKSAPATGDDALRRGIVDVVNELYAAQLVTATGGNVSARIPERDEAWITPSQLFKGDLAPEILVRVDFDGRGVDRAARSPSSEALMHTALYRAREDVRAVIHAHAPHATILANAGLPFLPISTEAAFFADLPRVPFIMPGTKDLADAVVEAMGDGWAVLLQNHGLLVAGRSLRRAADMAEIIERTSQVILGCYAVGREPPVLPDETVKMLRRYGDLMA